MLMDILAFLAALLIGLRTFGWARVTWDDGNRGGGIGVGLLAAAVPAFAAYMLFIA